MLQLSDEINKLLLFEGNKREVRFRLDLLNVKNLKIGTLTFDGGKVDFNANAQLKRTGSLNVLTTELDDVDYLNDRINPVFLLKNGSKWEEFSLGIYLISSPKGVIGSRRRTLEVFDILMILKEDKFLERKFFRKGTNYVEAITQVINSAGIWDVNITKSDADFQIDKEFEMGTSKIDCVNSLLNEINYTSIYSNHSGTVISRPYILPEQRAVEYIYRDDSLSVITPDSMIDELDIFNVPNTWVVSASNPERINLISTYVNDNPDSITSTLSRRRSIVEYKKINDVFDQATLNNYTKRLAASTSNVYRKLEFKTALMPHHEYMDCLYIEKTDEGLRNRYIESRWSMDLKVGGLMTHYCNRVVTV